MIASLPSLLDGTKGRYTLELGLPRCTVAKSRYPFDAELRLPLVGGTLHTGRGPFAVEGRVAMASHGRKPYQGERLQKGEYVFTVGGGTKEHRVEFDLSFSKGLSDLATSIGEILSPYESNDLCRRLARLLLRAGEQADEVGRLCDRLARTDTPAGRLAYAEALWAHSRMLLLMGQEEAAAARAVEGSAQAAGSGLHAGGRMSRSGRVLATALTRFGRTGAAEQVGRALRTTAGGGDTRPGGR